MDLPHDDENQRRRRSTAHNPDSQGSWLPPACATTVAPRGATTTAAPWCHQRRRRRSRTQILFAWLLAAKVLKNNNDQSRLLKRKSWSSITISHVSNQVESRGEGVEHRPCPDSMLPNWCSKIKRPILPHSVVGPTTAGCSTGAGTASPPDMVPNRE